MTKAASNTSSRARGARRVRTVTAGLAAASGVAVGALMLYDATGADAASTHSTSTHSTSTADTGTAGSAGTASAAPATTNATTGSSGSAVTSTEQMPDATSGGS